MPSSAPFPRAPLSVLRRRAGAVARSPWSPRLLAGGALALLATLGLARPTATQLRGDEGTYVAMAESLARDLDLGFTALDRERLAAAEPTRALILQRADERVAYSKPLLYPLLSAPFVPLLGAWAPVAANVAALAGGLALALADLRRRFGRLEASWIFVTFVGAGAAVAWVGWRMSEALQLALALAGSTLAFAGLRPVAAAPRGRLERWLASPRAPLAGGLLLGLLASLREPNALLAVGAVAAALLVGRRRHALQVLGGAVAAYLAVATLSWAATGALNPYKAPRATFTAETGWPAGADSARALERFSAAETLATSSLGALPRARPRVTAYATLYFWIGRHSGALIYFPGAVALAAWGLFRRDRVGLAALGGGALLAAFYLLWLPDNYFGGETFFGNRYVLAALPLALAALVSAPPRRLLLGAWLVAALAGGSALASQRGVVEPVPTSQGHAYAGLFRLLPYESTASNLDGRRDRYWSEDFLRFVDPNARVDAWSFTLSSLAAPAEVLVATSWEGDPLRLLVATDVGSATLVVSDWRGERRFPLAEHAAGPAGGLVAVRPAPAWRVHPFWWAAEPAYRVRAIRLAIETPGPRPAKARVRYLGRYEPPVAGFGREVLSAPLPPYGYAGGGVLVPLRLRNTSSFEWTSDAVLPVQLAFRIEPADGGPGLIGEGRTRLPRAVAPGEEVAVTVRVDLPPIPGEYRVTIDLVLEDVAWFGDRLEAPVATGVVEVRPG